MYVYVVGCVIEKLRLEEQNRILDFSLKFAYQFFLIAFIPVK